MNQNKRNIKWVNVGIGVVVEDFKTNKILLGKRTDKNYHGVGTWCTPGGHINFGESLTDACRRETFEELGIVIKHLVFQGVTNDIFKEEGKHYITLWYSAQHHTGKLKKSTEELEDIGWFPRSKIPHPLFLSTKNYMQNIRIKC